jgi:hypothetical protein
MGRTFTNSPRTSKMRDRPILEVLSWIAGIVGTALAIYLWLAPPRQAPSIQAAQPVVVSEPPTHLSQQVAASRLNAPTEEVTSIQLAQPTVASAPPADISPQAAAARLVSLPEGAKHILSRRDSSDHPLSYAIEGSSSSVVAAVVLAPYTPHRLDGSFLIVYAKDPSQRAWSTTWSSDPSPQDPIEFLRQHRQPPGGDEYIEVYTRGSATFHFK